MTNPQTTNVISFDAYKVRTYLDSTINGFLNDPPEGNFQKGFLSAVIVIWEEALGKTKDARTEKLRELCQHEKLSTNVGEQP